MTPQSVTRVQRLGARPKYVAALALTLTAGQATIAQQPVPATPLAPYRLPALALVQPANSASIPQDRPIIALRFVPGDSSDPVDARSFTVAVDGKDRAGLFQLARDMAWGPLAPAEELSSLAVGAHVVFARICSIRGICAEVNASVNVSAAAAGTETQSGSRKRTLIDLLLAAMKKLLAP